MRRVLLIFSSILLLLIIIFVANQSNSNNSVDLLEAYKIANAEAVKWDESAQPYFITSVDDSAESKFVKGENGKRNNWNFDFVVEDSNKHLIVTLHNKSIVSKIEAASHVSSDYIIDIDKICISTADAVKIAKDNYGLLPGTDWAYGYHFVLENNGSTLTLSVIGLNTEGDMSRILFNATTGKVINPKTGLPIG